MKRTAPARTATVSRRDYDRVPMGPPGQGRDGPRASRSKRSGLGRRLTAARLDAGLTQEQLAKRLGADLSTLQRWELGESEPRGLYRRAVEKFLARK